MVSRSSPFCVISLASKPIRTVKELEGKSIQVSTSTVPLIIYLLKSAGVDMPAGVTVKVVENTDKHVHLVLPPKPTGDISDESLEKIAAGQSGKEFDHHEPGGPG